MKKIIEINFNTELLAALEKCSIESISSEETGSLNSVRLESAKFDPSCDETRENDKYIKTENVDFASTITEDDSSDKENNLLIERGKTSKNLKTQSKIKKKCAPIPIKILKANHKLPKQESQENSIDVKCEQCLQFRTLNSFHDETSHRDLNISTSSSLPNGLISNSDELSSFDKEIVNFVSDFEKSYRVENSVLRNFNIPSSKADAIEKLKKYFKDGETSSSNCDFVGSVKNNYLNGYSKNLHLENDNFKKVLNELYSRDLKIEQELNLNKTVFIQPSDDTPVTNNTSHLNRIGMVLKDSACRRLLSAGILNFKKLCEEENNLMFNMTDQCLRGEEIKIIKIVEDCEECMEKKRTTLHQAVMQKNVELIFCLVKYQKILKDSLFEINNSDEKRFTPLDYAEKLNMDENIINYLKENGAKNGVRL